MIYFKVYGQFLFRLRLDLLNYSMTNISIALFWSNSNTNNCILSKVLFKSFWHLEPNDATPWIFLNKNIRYVVSCNKLLFWTILISFEHEKFLDFLFVLSYRFKTNRHSKFSLILQKFWLLISFLSFLIFFSFWMLLCGRAIGIILLAWAVSLCFACVLFE